MEKILSKASGSERFSFLDGFSGYNQVLVQESDWYKTTFTDKWGTYAYWKIPFGITNAGDTFQNAREMDFKGVLERFVLIHLDDITIYWKHATNHFDHLKQVFIKCKEYGVSLNPRKCMFSTDQGKFLGYIMSRNFLKIVLKRVE